jgi:glycosyltransferase 2 family protein
LDLDQVVVAVRGARVEWLATSVVLALTSMLGLALGWRRALVMVGMSVPWRSALGWYFVGQLGKYLPGGVWSVVGAAELAVGGGASRARAYGAMLLALGAAYLAATGTAVALLPFQPALVTEVPWAVALAALVPLGVLATHPRVLGYMVRLVASLSKKPIELEIPSWAASVRLMARHVPVWLTVGISTWCVAQSLGAAAPMANIAAATILAWVVGFLVVPAPGGLGVREAVFMLAATSLEPAMAAAVAVVARALFMFVDALAAGLVLLARSSGRMRGGDDGG